MKAIILAAVSLIVMQLNQDLNPLYWIGFVAYAASLLVMAYKLDVESNKRKNYGRKKH